MDTGISISFGSKISNSFWGGYEYASGLPQPEPITSPGDSTSSDLPNWAPQQTPCHFYTAEGIHYQVKHGEVDTISPKDALLEAAERASPFPPDDFVNGVNSFQATLPYTQMETFSSQSARQAASLPQQLNHSQLLQTRRTTSSLNQQTPKFLAFLTTMESIKSESIDSGIYSHPYRDRTVLFKTPAKLQKHKRKAGPFICNWINYSGEPCNSTFSRPYEKARHERTIHNTHKENVRCDFCTGERTFSRNDALTRHIHLVHQEVCSCDKCKALT
ncbi:hypothetical protein BGW36DRAFT_431175 [Talaromyces proteolyticus]|uniref:C2H2-type domain-containing protein n=1 Tax=Talaromyces proteolyticus TaxID=1131652 RepID=A0AAD4PSR9_9EURO|nr:uncharacterized protein BGW36DRAFT_431175 [Talaromyces proteolyticus]KAH8691931.1 hypothetical protein BGW36DRAFT_431175 [Talaromyces proteolyticus]